jgi:aminoglycoside 3-N-acetyltransferase
MSINREEIVAGLQALGLGRGMAVEVHSALSSLGWVAGGAETVIDALMDVIGCDGTLIMSAYPVSPALPLTEEEIARGILWKVRILEDPHERSGLGLIVDTFRKRPDVILGNGLHRVCAWGRDATLHAQTQYRRLVEIDGWTLLIGVGVDRVSSLHQADENPGAPEAIQRRFTPPSELRHDYPPDGWDIGYDGAPNEPYEDAWVKAWKEAGRRGLIREGKIGHADCALFKTRALLEILQDGMRKDPYGLYGIKR